MFRIVVLVSCFHHLLSQPVSSDVSTRFARELIECCPCPENRGTQAWLDESQLVRPEDDCPCRVRDADSHGASSIFFPASLLPESSSISEPKTISSKEDPKNLLEPEVTLATSVLDTLREVTEEEYREALEREAVRNVADSDLIPEESARSMIFVVNPKNSDNDEDFNSEASHVQESRCIHPLETLSVGKMRSSTNQIDILPKLMKLPKLKLEFSPRNLLHFDSDLGASNVEESIVNPSRNVLTFSDKDSEGKKAFMRNRKDDFKFRTPNLKLGKFNDNESTEAILLPKSKLFINKADDDLHFVPNNIQNQSEAITDYSNSLLENSKFPLSLKNLFKLRDVEFIPKPIRNKPWAKPKIDISKFAIPTLFKPHRNKNCNEDEKYVKDSTSKPNNRNFKEITITNLNDDITTNREIEESLFENTFENLIIETSTPIHGIINEFNSNKNIDLNANVQDFGTKESNLNTLPSPSQTQSSYIETVRNMDLETIVPIKSDYVRLKESDGNDEVREIIDTSQKTDLNPSTFGNSNFGSEDDINLNTLVNGFTQFQDINIDQDSATDSTNAITFALTNLEITTSRPEESQENITAESESTEKHITHSKAISEKIAETLDDGDTVSYLKEVAPLSETLTRLRETVVKQLENLKEPSTNSELLRKLSKNDSVNDEKEHEIVFVENDDQILTISNAGNDCSMEAKDNVTKISMNDLQKMSDKLLGGNIVDQDEKETVDSTITSATDEINLNSNKINDKNEAMKNLMDIERVNNTKENACPVNLEIKNVSLNENNELKSVILDDQQKEMDSAASDTVINTLPGILDALNPNLKLRAPLLSDVGLPPPSDPLNLFGKPFGDALNLNTNLPTLDDIREQLVNIFNNDNESLENDSSFLETDYTNVSPHETMATEASTRNFQKEPTLLKQLKDFNHNIIQKKPKKTPFDAQKKSHMHDISSYRAHLPSPSSLELQPTKIEPRARNRAKEITMLRKYKPSPLINPIENLPTLEDLKYTLRSKTNNLLDIPVHSDLNILKGNSRSNNIEEIAKSIRLNTEKTFKGLQRKMKWSPRKPNVGDSLTKPQDLLDDMNDKLKGIHYDLNDRLASLRENILDSTRLRADDQPRKAANTNIMFNLRKSKTKPISSRLQTSASTAINHEIPSNLLRLETRNFIAPDSNRLEKIQNAAESALTSKSVKAPLSYLQRVSPLFRQTPTATESIRKIIPNTFSNGDLTESKETKKPLFKAAAIPLNSQRQKNKVTISFETTTLQPFLLQRSVVRVPNMALPQYEKVNSQSPPCGSINTSSKGNIPVNSKSSSGRFTPLRTSAPIPPPFEEEYEDTLNKFDDEEIPSKGIQSKPSIFREMSKPDLQVKTHRLKPSNIFDEKIENIASKPAKNTPDLPRIIEDSLLSRSRDSVNLRMLSNVPKPIKNVKTEQLDMLRSPTENTSTVLDEPLKENISYRCRMVCNKEIR